LSNLNGTSQAWITVTGINQNGSQQHVAISTKTPTWGWEIRNSRIIGASFPLRVRRRGALKG
jgi:hypothetical protein